ncbi:ATPase [Cupriavidus pampae]|uniref:ATPase n=1 Tax=Cupriavidus pampae TaxID=659251 RepID=A0ABM8XZW4_9BURK|nr:ATPase [Cupriavidus pampae]CAG9186003.1 hypothetical protein LMG32289_06204 [Cupriavidus pampae]
MTTTAEFDAAAEALADDLLAAGDATSSPDDAAASATPPEDVEAELTQMAASADALRAEGIITTADADAKKAEVERTRKRFRELSPEDRQAIVRRRRELGMQILTRQLSGAAVVVVGLKINHTRLRPLFEQWWPYMNRMSLNLQRFGQNTFSRAELATIEKYLEAEMVRIEEYVDEQLRVATAYREQREKDMTDRGDYVFRPEIVRPAIELEVQAYSRFAVRALQVLIKFDKTMDEFDFMVWNGIRDQTDVNEEVTRFLRKFQPLGLRSFTTHLKLMETVRAV